jgi:alpha-L-fucosidase
MMKRYETSVGRNTNMLLGMVIDNNGRVPEVDANELILLGKAIKAKYGHPYKSSHREGTDITLSLNKPAYIDRTVIQEDIRMGELVLKYEIKGLSNGQWIKTGRRKQYWAQTYRHLPTNTRQSCPSAHFII